MKSEGISETESVFFWVSDGILHIKIKEGSELTLEQTFDDRMKIKELVGFEKLPVLIDANSFFSITDEGRLYAASEHAHRNSRAVAYFTNHLSSAILLRNFKQLNKPVVRTEIFRDKQQALQWLQSEQ